MILHAEWTDDCQGKKDYDGEILSISTRYWPAGGGFDLLHPDGRFEGNEARPEIRPSAKCGLVIWHDDGDCTSIATQDFDGESFEEVAKQVEAWAQRMMGRAVAALKSEFSEENAP